MKLSARSGSETISQTVSIGAETTVLALDLTAASPEHREPPLGRQGVKRVLHETNQVVIDLVEVGIGAELSAQIDRGERFDSDLGRERDMPEHVADVQPPGEGERDRQHLEAEQAVEREHAGQSLAAADKERRLLASDRHH